MFLFVFVFTDYFCCYSTSLDDAPRPPLSQRGTNVFPLKLSQGTNKCEYLIYSLYTRPPNIV